MRILKLALVGKDVAQSDSENIHRFILKNWGAECLYEKVSVTEEKFESAIERLMEETDGFNVTIPYKRRILKYLARTAGDAAATGAVNTVVTASRTGYNTDGMGFMRMLDGAGISVKGRTAIIVGAGGAGISVAAALKKAGARVFLCRRNKALLREACEKIGAEEAREIFPCDLLVNGTGVGMHDSVGKSPLEKAEIGRCGIAVDLIYRPAESEFLRLARECGKKTLNGRAMLFYQAYYADCLYLDKPAEKEESERLYAAYLACFG